IFIRPLWQNFANWVIKTKKYPILEEYINNYISQQSTNVDQIQLQNSYINDMFKTSSSVPVMKLYYDMDSNGNTIYSTEDGLNWWFVNSEGLTTPISGQIPQNIDFKLKPFSELK